MKSDENIYKLIDPDTKVYMVIVVSSDSKEETIERFMTSGSSYSEINQWISNLKTQNKYPLCEKVRLTVSNLQVEKAAQGLSKILKCKLEV